MLTRKKVLISLAFYMIVLIWIISFKMNMKQPVFECLIYFSKYSIKEKFQMAVNVFDILNSFKDLDFYVNICFFMPLGVYCLELIKKHSFIKGLVVAFLLTLTLEAIQLFTNVGFFTFTDIISNSLGYVFGYLIYKGLNKWLGKKVMYYVFSVFTVFFIVLAIYGIVNTIINVEIYNLDYYK